MEKSFRHALTSRLRVPNNCPPANLHEISGMNPLWHLQHTKVTYASLGRMLGISHNVNYSTAFWNSVVSDPSYDCKVTLLIPEAATLSFVRVPTHWVEMERV